VTTKFPPVFVFAVPVVLFLTFWALCYIPIAGLVRVVKASAKSGSGWVERSRIGRWATGHSGPVGSYAPILLLMVVGGIAAIGADTCSSSLPSKSGSAPRWCHAPISSSMPGSGTSAGLP